MRIEKTKRFRPQINQHIEDMVKKCSTCQQNDKKQQYDQ